MFLPLFHSGCDGKNYSNACGAWSMGVSVSSMGECGEDGGVEFVETSSTSVPLLGSSYCTYSPNTTCYPSGWPSCCGVDSGASCPEEQPPCDYCEVGPAANASLGCGTPGQFCQLEWEFATTKRTFIPASESKHRSCVPWT